MSVCYKKKLAAMQISLAERQADLVSYTRVLRDMALRKTLPFASTFGGPQVLTLVAVCRDDVRRDCEKLQVLIKDLEQKAP